jgi:hypothetical protein
MVELLLARHSRTHASNRLQRSRQRFGLIGALVPALMEAHLLVLFPVVLAPMPDGCDVYPPALQESDLK